MSIGAWFFGRPHIAEEQLSPMQYHDFMDDHEFVISFNMANSILLENADGNYEEVVPCDQLKIDHIRKIEDSVFREGCLAGKLKNNILFSAPIYWQWKPVVKDDEGHQVQLDNIPNSVLGDVITKMLEDGCHSVYVEDINPYDLES